MSDSELKPEGWAAIIPEFYFDLISRIPAGMFLLTGLSLIFTTSDQHNKVTSWLMAGDLDGFPFTLTFICLFVGGYAVSILLIPLAYYVRRIYFLYTWRTIEKDYPEEINKLIKNEKRSEKDFNKLYRNLHDELKSKHPHAKVLLPKLSAEVSLCDNFASAILILALSYVYVTRAWVDIQPKLVIFAAFGFVYCVFAGQHRFLRLIQGHLSFWNLVANTTEPNPAVNTDTPQ